MLIVSQDELSIYNFETSARVSFKYDCGEFILIIYFPAHEPEIEEPMQFYAGDFKRSINCQRCLKKLIDAYANGEKVFRIPEEEELNDDND